jgi:hypothetical protein
MTRKRFSEEDILGILRQIELGLSSGSTVEMAILQVISEAVVCFLITIGLKSLSQSSLRSMQNVRTKAGKKHSAY